MIGPPTARANSPEYDVSEAYESDTFATILQWHHAPDDTRLAELIEQDGRHRILRGLPVPLERYLDDVPDLLNRQLPLDAAIDVTLRSMSRSTGADMRSVDELVERYPALEKLIREAAALNNAMWSTTRVHSSMTALVPRSLPAEFGPTMPDGRPRYMLQRLLGSGAFGQVYEGVDRQLSEDDYEALVAVKILAGQGRTPWSRHRLIEEASKARRVDHENVVRVIDRGVSEEDEDFIVYELVDGGDLSRWIRDRTLPIGPREAARLVAQIARGVQAAHAAGLVHCDLKPGNIMLTGDGKPKVADFGIAIRAGESFSELRNDDEKHPMGNLAFISPEQYRMEENALTAPSDIYALGGILYLLVTGELPNGASIEEIAHVHDGASARTRPPSPRAARPEIDCDLDAICRRALAVRPEDRHSSAGALADDLEGWLNHEPLQWVRPSAYRIAKLWMKRRPAVAAATLLLAASVIIGSIAAHLLHRRATMLEHHALQAEQQAMQAQHEAEVEGLQRREQERLNELIRERIINILSHMEQNYEQGYAAQHVLSVLWVMQYILDERAEPYGSVSEDVWELRRTSVEDTIALALAEGRSGDIDVMLWRTILAFWLVESSEFDEAFSNIERIKKHWGDVLSPDDHWMQYVNAIESSAIILELAARVEDAPHALSGDIEAPLLHHTERLKGIEALIAGGRKRASPLHRLVVRSLITAHEPALLDDAASRQAYEETAAKIRM